MNHYLNDKLGQFYTYFLAKRYEDAARVCEIVIGDSRQALLHREDNPEEENNLRYVAGILFKGFAEFIQLQSLITGFNWHDNKKVESIWYLLCDCTDHLNFSAGAMETEPLTDILGKLKIFLGIFEQMFGKGLYMSPVIVIKKEICSICKLDVRGCEHRQGRLYNGIICRHVAESISSMRGADLVTVPKDPRCRVWPWNEKEKNVFDVRLLNMNMIDDFLYE